ncbi:MAG: S8 family serine peptidase [Bacteroidetes bacterium]|nr:S8 family serine peptidase [Bacteroidota bacterium]
MKIPKYILIIILIISCTKNKTERPEFSQTKKFDHWHLKDYESDGVPGISLDKLYDELIKNQKGKQIIVAIIDTEIDINHEDLKDFIWINNDEQPNNGVDDDNNGYVDDVNGWNFIGNKNGGNLICSNFSYTRKLKELIPIFKGKTKEEVGNDTLNFKIYQRALMDHQNMKRQLKEDYEYVEFLNTGFPRSKKLLDSIFRGSTYTINQLDSLYTIFKKQDSIKAADIYFMIDFLNFDMHGYADNLAYESNLIEKYSNNISFDDRAIIGDNVNDIEDRDYGSPFITNSLKEFTHGSIVSGVLAAHRTNNKGVRGITNTVKLMPLCIQAKFGAETDKDLALSIKYAVENGAQVINISANRTYELHNEWVQQALLYAEEQNVLVVKGAGNSETDIDKIITYPNKNTKDHVLNNFIVVGATGMELNSNFKPVWANYGRKTVDFYAPGESILTTTPFDSYKVDSGSSLSTAITSGVAALLLSYYPDLKVSEIRQILMESATRYDLDIELDYDSNTTVPFSKLSNSGGVLNAFNAFVLAEKISHKSN